MAYWDAATANDFFYYLIMVGVSGLQTASGENYYGAPPVLLYPVGQQPLCVQVSVTDAVM